VFKLSPEHRRQSRQTYWIRRAKLDALKDRPCTDCHRLYPPYVMQFDHRVKSEKKFNIAAAFYHGPWSEVLAEIEKCDLVCANCHAERTWGSKLARGVRLLCSCPCGQGMV
jgi:hypothetical protein